MGYSGGIYVARAEQAPEIGAHPVLWEKAYPGGWHYRQLDGYPDATALQDLVTATGAPALAAFVLDSDMAEVTALTPAGIRWKAYLHTGTALHGYDFPPLEQPLDEVVRLAVDWSAEAGLAADADAVRTALNADNVLAEETFGELLDALGVTTG